MRALTDRIRAYGLPIGLGTLGLVLGLVIAGPPVTGILLVAGAAAVVVAANTVKARM